jgi:hypothetical protein
MSENQSVLDPPPIAREDPDAVEVLRVWAAPGQPQQVCLSTTWTAPAAWGLLMVDVARHAAQAYAREGHDPAVVLAEIREAFDVEWFHPTDSPTDLSGSA